ncbi:uncharacterized protein FMAN_05485 [Fusarium mangiferae]|uniref:Uncharacterized protein n=1 Tax=Fusarium mangiferae TaxID=192010 RepID=A0A1L7SYH4_FUSMA|nr:uncharacterized protein FMAN_05485 [Fusarium mangiferae]CVK87566.1 uncharacterized protein FMAN_05485 [Fusarium mangiferae]
MSRTHKDRRSRRQRRHITTASNKHGHHLMKDDIEEALLMLRYNSHLHLLGQTADQSQRGLLPWDPKRWDPNSDSPTNGYHTDDEDRISVNEDEDTTTLEPPTPENNDTQLSDQSSKRRLLEDKPRRRATI